MDVPKLTPYGGIRWRRLQSKRAAHWRKKYPRGKISRWFRWDEFLCKDMYRSVPPILAEKALVRLCKEILDPMRTKFGPAHVMSGYRPRPYNDAIPGAAGQSQHIYDESVESVAADLVFSVGTPRDWAMYARHGLPAKGIKVGGVGLYPGFIHLDNGPRRDW